MILPCFANTIFLLVADIGVTSPLLHPIPRPKRQSSKNSDPFVGEKISALQDIIYRSRPPLLNSRLPDSVTTETYPDDLAILTGETCSNDELDSSLKNSVSILKDDTILLDGEGHQATGTINQIEWRRRKEGPFDNALDATRAVVEEGIVPGRGTALLEASKALDGLMLANFELGGFIDPLKVVQTALTDTAGDVASLVKSFK
ncbi:hypothetical protein PSHT_01215 [Puccinia striiformis]|uniref:Uncharacterized protein n=1 Tax=Puccinia striiformis TaxID=27350 RepID=A0A2S4WLA8_9BASI|nr:hypothetical protein PSHT_01215 [Puccinia striiformis]